MELMIYYPSFDMEYLRTMPLKEYFLRANSIENQYNRKRFESAKSIIDNRIANNATHKEGEKELFSITNPLQLFDFIYFDNLLKGIETERSELAKLPQEIEAENVKRFYEIKARMVKKFEERRKTD